MENKQLRKKKVTITFDELILDGDIVAYANMDSVALFNYEQAKRKNLPALIIDCQHLSQRKADEILNNPVFRDLITDNIAQAEKAGFCIGLRMMPQHKKCSKDGNK